MSSCVRVVFQGSGRAFVLAGVGYIHIRVLTPISLQGGTVCQDKVAQLLFLWLKTPQGQADSKQSVSLSAVAVPWQLTSTGGQT